MFNIWGVWLGEQKMGLSTWATGQYIRTKDENVKKYVTHSIDVMECILTYGDDEELRGRIDDADQARTYYRRVRQDIPRINKLVFGKERLWSIFGICG